jgi:hypothetical protein
MTEILTMHDGTQLYGCAEERDENLYLYVHGKTKQEMEDILSDPDKTETIVSERNDGLHTYEGYTVLKELNGVGEHFVAATMNKNHGGTNDE